MDGRDCCQTGQFSQDVADGALTDLRRMDEIMEALDNRSSMDWCVAVHDMNAGFDEKILFPSSVESTAG
ncbi:hypothetical protein [Escherichia coli]|uniref:hypothetical protein n=1 Tax=Escherichia coli TaxID=562 RepID=UPI0005CD517A|nr:hypothetical protein [Escherichia coli]AUF79587.1 hypothetical protein CGC46_08865 [Escherichia coli O121:H19]AWJ30180.1 hypothetical protein I3S_06700 [Escherichia coli O121 str. RM8352]MCM4774999.1 hypothetical protein [Escherichia coli]MCM4780208.1 hypothetical protein [Escherichia coli]QCH75263.1 hypothetical protein B9X35_017435 [Escherichia coli O121:H19]